jgi:hypothetical protein
MKGKTMSKRIIQISDSIKQEIAERVVEMAHPGYSADYQGNYYVVNGERVMHRQSNARWNPWSDDADVIHVNDLVWYFGGAKQENADFDPTPAEGYDEETGTEIAVGFALGYVPDSYDQDHYDRIGA